MFVGAIIVGIVGNAAEHSSAILLARKGKIDLSIGIAAGSGSQIALCCSNPSFCGNCPRSTFYFGVYNI